MISSQQTFWSDVLHDLINHHKRRQNVKSDPDRNLRRHWRRSLQKYTLPPWQATPDHATLRDSLNATYRKEETTAFPYLQLLPELRIIIESFLSPADVICLRQTCQLLRATEGTSGCSSVGDLAPIHLYSLRRRLDRDSFHILCHLETMHQLPRNLAACSACLTLHKAEYFQIQHIQHLLPQVRKCAASQYVFQICDGYVASATFLRELLEQKADNQTPSVSVHDLQQPKSLVISRILNHRHIEKEFVGPFLGGMSSIGINSSGLYLVHQNRGYFHNRGFRLWWGAEYHQWLCPYIKMDDLKTVLNVTCVLAMDGISVCPDVTGCMVAFAFMNPSTGLSRDFRDWFLAGRLTRGSRMINRFWIKRIQWD